MNPSPDPKPIFTALIEALTKLPPLLAFGGLVLVVGAVVAWLTGQFSDLLLVVPLVVIGAFLIYAYVERRAEWEKQRLEHQLALNRLEQEREKQRLEQELEKQRLEIERLKVEQEGKLKQTQQEQQGQQPPKPVEPTEDLPASWPTSYYRAVWHQCLQMQMTSIDPKAQELGAAVFRLHHIFTTLDVPKSQEWKVNKKQVEPVPTEQREAAFAVLSRPENRKMVLLGQPGSGKSTLIKYLALGLSGEGLGESETNLKMLYEQGWQLTGLLPVLVVLRDYAAKGLPKNQKLWDFVAEQLRGEKLGGCLQQLRNHLQGQGGLLLLDGLDEVPEAHQRREQLRQAILAFVGDFPNVRVLVTSRPYAYQDPNWRLPGFNQTTLLDFTPQQIKSYIERWYEAAAPQDPNLGAVRAGQYAQQLKAQVKQNPKLGELAPRPLLLALKVSLQRWRGGGLLPQRREQLYDAAVNLLLDLWQRPKLLLNERGEARQQEGNALTELGIDTLALRRALSQLAFEVHAKQAEASGTADIAHEALVAALRQVMPKEKRDQIAYAKIANYVRDRAGLLEDRGQDVYGFPHRTFQEYLAAMHLLDQAEFPTNIVALVQADIDRWREATLLAGNTAQTALQWALVESLYGRREAPQGEVGEGQWWGAFLAGQVIHDADLLDKVTAVQEPSVREVKGWQRAIVSQGALPPRERARVGDLLAEWGDDRPGVLGCDEMPLCYVPPGAFWLADKEKSRSGRWMELLNQPYWLGQYPVTVAQFREFVKTSGYRPSDSDSLAGVVNRPVVWISWYDALAFCEWLNKRWQKWLPAGYRVTLPNEPEWEKGARGGRQIPLKPQPVTAKELSASLANPPALQDNPLPQREYPWGNEPSQEQVAGRAIYRANDEPAGINTTSAVGAFPAGASPHGCLDMAGNVLEWSRSFYNKPRPYRLSPEYETTDRENRAPLWLCGSSYYVNYNGCSARGRNDPDFPHHYYVGLRVAVSPFPPLTSVPSGL